MDNEDQKDIWAEEVKQEEAYEQYVYLEDPTLPKKKSFFKTGWGILVIVLLCILGIPLVLFGACMILVVGSNFRIG